MSKDKLPYIQGATFTCTHINYKRQVICPWEKGFSPKGYRQRGFLSHETSYMCALGHLHKVGDFPELTTNDIKSNQIHTR